MIDLKDHGGVFGDKIKVPSFKNVYRYDYAYDYIWSNRGYTFPRTNADNITLSEIDLTDQSIIRTKKFIMDGAIQCIGYIDNAGYVYIVTIQSDGKQCRYAVYNSSHMLVRQGNLYTARENYVSLSLIPLKQGVIINIRDGSGPSGYDSSIYHLTITNTSTVHFKTDSTIQVQSFGGGDYFTIYNPVTSKVETYEAKPNTYLLIYQVTTDVNNIFNPKIRNIGDRVILENYSQGLLKEITQRDVTPVTNIMSNWSKAVGATFRSRLFKIKSGYVTTPLSNSVYLIPRGDYMDSYIFPPIDFIGKKFAYEIANGPHYLQEIKEQWILSSTYLLQVCKLDGSPYTRAIVQEPI